MGFLSTRAWGLAPSSQPPRVLSAQVHLKFDVVRGLRQYRGLTLNALDELKERFEEGQCEEDELESIVHRELLENAQGASSFLRSLAQRHLEKGLDPNLENAMNANQLQCKFWILDVLSRHLAPPVEVQVLGGWVGVLSALLREHLGWKCKLQTIDIDPEACSVARYLLRDLDPSVSVSEGDMMRLTYRSPETLLVNTSCEHLPYFSQWWDSLPSGQLVLLQSNDYFQEPTHVNCVASLEAFQEQAPLGQTLYAGSLRTKKYTRFMLLGRK